MSLVCNVSGELARVGPSFVVEPPSLVQFAVGAGATLRCVAAGEPPPAITWLTDDGTPLEDAPGLRFDLST
ncbi:hypothetical protein K1T71_001562 [Dendrolimus kikuchii]|uniref:Uncharacterized protein n=1 Tax=Dendrolimus kikuchii TaxID=765133 RepID=A0ACC1DE24_9NEOP|nr:hypothetical protein K1T71_001562 [Dendrolimus kikuchii]